MPKGTSSCSAHLFDHLKLSNNLPITIHKIPTSTETTYDSARLYPITVTRVTTNAELYEHLVRFDSCAWSYRQHFMREFEQTVLIVVVWQLFFFKLIWQYLIKWKYSFTVLVMEWQCSVNFVYENKDFKFVFVFVYVFIQR